MGTGGEFKMAVLQIKASAELRAIALASVQRIAFTSARMQTELAPEEASSCVQPTLVIVVRLRLN